MRLPTPIETEVNFRELERSWYTIVGCGGDLQNWVDGYTKELQDAGIGTPTKWVQFTGAMMNVEYELTGNNAYKDALAFLAFPTDGFDIAKLAIFKMTHGDHWFDEIVSRNNHKQRQEKGE